MNHPVGNRYGDRLMPLGPNSRSDGSMEESETVSVTVCSFCAHFPAPARWRTAALYTRRAWTTQSIFTILSIERQRVSLAAVVSGQLTEPSAVLVSQRIDDADDGYGSRSVRFRTGAQRLSRGGVRRATPRQAAVPPRLDPGGR